VTGLEPSAIRAKIARERHGLKVIPSYIEHFNSSENFDVIIMRHIIEHLENPLSVLKTVRAHLKKDGLILIIVPNIDCIGRFIFDTKWTWVLPWHCNFFNPKSIASLLNKAGFEVLKSYQMPSPLWYPKSFLRVLPFGANFIKALYSKLSALSFIFFIPLIALGFISGLSDNLTIIAKSK
jgi:SAM-dependent methyltransferase